MSNTFLYSIAYIDFCNVISSSMVVEIKVNVQYWISATNSLRVAVENGESIVVFRVYCSKTLNQTILMNIRTNSRLSTFLYVLIA